MKATCRTVGGGGRHVCRGGGQEGCNDEKPSLPERKGESLRAALTLPTSIAGEETVV